MEKKPPPVDDTITVTTATGTEAEVRASLGIEEPVKEAATSTDEDQDPGGPVADLPSPDVSDAAKKLGENRLSVRTARLRDDNALYEDNIRRMGGTVPVFAPRAYTKPQDEIDHLSRHRHDLMAEVNRVLRTPPKAAAVIPPAGQPVVAKPEEPKAPTFTFPTWDDYQVQHPEADYSDWIDARTDARVDFKEAQVLAKQQRVEDTRRAAEEERREIAAYAERDRHVDAFRAKYPDFDEKLAKVTIDGQAPAYPAFQKLLVRHGDSAAQILYYLADHPEDATRLNSASNMAALLETFGEVKYAATHAKFSKSAVKADDEQIDADRTVRSSTAPEPLTGIPGRAFTTRSLRALAEKDDDADEYIASRRQQLRGAR